MIQNQLFKVFVIIVLTRLTFSSGISAQRQTFDQIGFTEKLDEYIPGDIILIDENNDAVNLKQLIDKPTVITFVYFRCPGICSPLLNNLTELFDRSDLILGKDYQSFTISFDYTEGTALSTRKKQNLLNMMTKSSDARDHWRFFTADSVNVARATQSMGFNYKRTGNDFIHTGGIIVISPDGKITRYLNGINFLPFELKLAVLEASKGQSGPSINKIMSYCFSYDPKGQQYALNITRVSGILIISVAFVFFIYLVLKQTFKPKQKKSN